MLHSARFGHPELCQHRTDSMMASYRYLGAMASNLIARKPRASKRLNDRK